MTQTPTNDSDAITGFNGPWFGLSPSAPLSKPITELHPTVKFQYPTLRKAYHGARTHRFSLKSKMIAARTSADLQSLIPERSDYSEWQQIKERVMMSLLREKFRDKTSQRLLMRTGHRPLIYVSDINDTYWGVDANGRGHNRYGVLLMKLRAEFLAQEDPAA